MSGLTNTRRASLVEDMTRRHERDQRSEYSLERKRRGKLGTLKNLRLLKRNQLKYALTFVQFLQFCLDVHHRLARDHAELNKQVEDYVEELWATGRPKSRGNYVVAAVQHYVTSSRGHLKGAWHLLKT